MVGGGVIKLAKHIPALQLRHLKQLYNSTDECTRNTTRATVSPSELRKLWLSLRDSPDQKQTAREVNEADIDESAVSSKVWRDVEFCKWCKLSSQGVGISVFKKDKISNAWLYNFTNNHMVTSESILALKLRTNMILTLSTVGRDGRDSGKPDKCRLCGKYKETLRHIVSKCEILQRNRMKRHNKICDLLRFECESKGWTLTRERRLSLSNAVVGVPDLIMVKNAMALVVDAAIPFEVTESTLADSEQGKTNKYSKFSDVIRHLYHGVNNVCVSGFPIGARRKWHQKNTFIHITFSGW